MINGKMTDGKTSFSILPMAIIMAAVLWAAPGYGEEVTYKTLPVGQKAPLLKTVTIDGQPFDLQETLSKKGVLLLFWSLFCSPCREEMPYVQKLFLELKEQPVEIIGVNLDEPPLHNAVRNFLKSSGFNFPIIVSKSAAGDSQADKLFLITGTPVIYIVKQDGSVAFAHVGRLEPEDLRKVVKENLLPPGM